eukprot:767554-Hanusia_phi.AAC.1
MAQENFTHRQSTACSKEKERATTVAGEVLIADHLGKCIQATILQGRHYKEKRCCHEAIEGW